VAAKENAELAVQFQVPPSIASQHALVTMARGMLEKATLHKDVLVKGGMAAQLLDDLAERSGSSSRPSKRRWRAGASIGATADLEAVAAEIAEQVKVLDGLVRYRFGEDAELMGAWASARNVLGPFKPKDKPEAGGSQTPKAA